MLSKINIVLIVVQILLIVLGVFLYKNKFKNRDKSNHMLREILHEGFNHSSLSEASQNILQILKKYYKVDYVTIYINKTNRLYTVASNTENVYMNQLEEYANELISNMKNFVAKTKISKGGSLSYDTAEERSICFLSFTPLHFNDKLIGAVLIEKMEAEDMKKSKNRIVLYSNIIENIALILQNVVHYDNVLSKLLKDELTGVYNRRFINETLPEQIKRHNNLRLSFTIAILDIDHFKKFNDTYGHQFGDRTLKQVSNFIKDNLTENDWIARYGGEEFVIFLAKTDKDNGHAKIDDIREKLSKLVITDGKIEANVTGSFGIAEYLYHEEGVNSDELIKRADKAVYVSKDTGRNRVTSYAKYMQDIKSNK